MLLLEMLCIGLGVAVLWPDLPIGKQLRALLIEAPARLLSKLTWAKVVATAALTAFFVGALFLAVNMQDGVVVFMALPEILVWMAAFDIATMLELSIVVAFAAASIRLGAVAQFVAARVANAFAPKPAGSAKSARARRKKPHRPAHSARDDDAPAWGFAFA